LHGYAVSESKDEVDGSHTLSWGKGDFKFHDNYFGGEPFGGRETVFLKNKPFWICTYYGYVIDPKQSALAVYKFLKKSLQLVNAGFPVRGPGKFSEGNWIYEMNHQGDLKNFAGHEKIYFKGELAYKCRFQGGFVDVWRS